MCGDKPWVLVLSSPIRMHFVAGESITASAGTLPDTAIVSMMIAREFDAVQLCDSRTTLRTRQVTAILYVHSARTPIHLSTILFVFAIPNRQLWPDSPHASGVAVASSTDVPSVVTGVASGVTSTGGTS